MSLVIWPQKEPAESGRKCYTKDLPTVPSDELPNFGDLQLILLTLMRLSATAVRMRWGTRFTPRHSVGTRNVLH